MSPRVPHPRRGVWRWLARAPLLLYRLGLGGLLGSRFVRLTHYGRKSGRRYHTVVEVAHRDPDTGTVFVVAGFGPRSDWYRNLQVRPETDLTLGRRTYPVRARFLSPDEGAAVLRTYIRQHPVAARNLGRMLLGRPLTPDDLDAATLRAFAAAHPVVAFEPRPGNGLRARP